MKPAQFEYRLPGSVRDAVLLLRDNEDAKVIAGGQSLVPLLNVRLAQPSMLVDVGRIEELRGVEVRDGSATIGALTTETEVLQLAPGLLPGLIPAAVAEIGHFQIRNRGTVGGSLAHADPAAEWPALALALGATVRLVGPEGAREVAAADFLVGPLWTAAESDEVLTHVRVPATVDGWGFAEVARRHGDFALVGVVAVRIGGEWAVVAFATGAMPHRLVATEEYLRGGGSPGDELVAIAAGEIDVRGDIHASPDYRRAVGSALVRRVVEQACE
ncbi:FAD binding domain-containing protein [Amycolatopsis jejuensis]|uniref:FAD binding domain-containing protein n=1 Tax=Amycolatopsis jejuensis TaxID=330084 RepID=UPI000524F43A|nr:FAD binding domain-containing protein [Amycolatopsis jejuensis]